MRFRVTRCEGISRTEQANRAVMPERARLGAKQVSYESRLSSPIALAPGVTTNEAYRQLVTDRGAAPMTRDSHEAALSVAGFIDFNFEPTVDRGLRSTFCP